MSGEEKDQIAALSNRVVPLWGFIWTVALTFTTVLVGGVNAWGAMNHKTNVLNEKVTALESRVARFEAAQKRIETNIVIIGERLGIGERLERPE